MDLPLVGPAVNVVSGVFNYASRSQSLRIVGFTVFTAALAGAICSYRAAPVYLKAKGKDTVVTEAPAWIFCGFYDAVASALYALPLAASAQLVNSSRTVTLSQLAFPILAVTTISAVVGRQTAQTIPEGEEIDIGEWVQSKAEYTRFAVTLASRLILGSLGILAVVGYRNLDRMATWIR